jgi:hypothetical protein
MSKVDEYFFRQITDAKLDQIISLLKTITKETKTMSVELDQLEVQVAQTDGVIDSAVVLINGVVGQLQALADELAAEGIDNSKVVAITNDLSARTEALAAAVAAVPPEPVP